MNTLPVKIFFQSDSLIGSGYGYGAVIDSDIVYDDLGLPCLPGKRLKGLLRDAATELLGILQPVNRDQLLSSLFGDSGADASAGVIYPDFRLLDYQDTAGCLRYFQSVCGTVIHPESVLSVMTDLRRQTSIDPATGTAKRTSLRTMRVLRKGVTFYGEIQYDQLPDEALELLRLSILFLRRIGTKRNKGLGMIACTLVDCDHQKLVTDSSLLRAGEVRS